MSGFLIVLLIIVFMFYYLNCIKNNNTNNNIDSFHQDIRGKSRTKSNIDYLDNLLNYTENNYSSLGAKNKTNNMGEFVEAQFHTDYRDTLTAFNNIAPAQKQIFNIANLPLEFTNPKKSETFKLIDDFIKQVNKNIETEVPDYRKANTGWDEPIVDQKLETGWEREMKNLGLPTSLYPDPAKKSPIKLIKLDHVEKYETDDEIRYICYLFIKKNDNSVKDILIIRVSFVLDKKIINEDRLFFNQRPTETSIVLEEIFVVGFMTNKGVGRDNQLRDSFYNFSDLEKDGMLDDSKIIKQLNKKLSDRYQQMQKFNNSMDHDFREIKKDAPDISNYNSYQSTQTIYDDMLRPRTYS